MEKIIFFIIFCLLFQGCFGSSLYDANKCGKKGIADHDEPKKEHKIMGGKDTEEGEYPFTVAIFYKDEYICTGTLISPQHVVTAAHCFSAEGGSTTYLKKRCKNDASCLQKHMGKRSKEKCKNGYLNPPEIIKNYEIGIGSHRLSNMTSRLKLQSIDSNYKNFYHSGCFENDLAILTLASDEMEDRREYACLIHTTGINMRDENMNVAPISLGWGSDPINNLKYHDVLQQLESGLFVQKVCQISWGNYFPVDGICVGESAEKNSCAGDSGGPLIYNDKENDRFVLLGILSFGTDCGDLRENTASKSSVFTRMDYYQEKINEIIGWENDNFDGLDFSDLHPDES